LAAALLSATVTYAADPPRLSAEALGPHRVRLLWSAPAGPVSGFQVWRNGQLLATLAPSAGVLLDEGLAARTLYRYEVAAIGGPRAVAALVTGPEIEAAALASGRFDVVIYGATPGGIAAAVTLGRRGRRVALVEPTPAIGGMLSGGLGRTDYGNIHALGGPFAAFMTAVDQYYASHYPADSPNQTLKRGGLYFEPHVAREILLGWLASVPSVTLYRDCPLAGATVEGGRLTAVIVDDTRRRLRRTLRAEVFIDAGYEGDLAAAAGCRYRLGRESHDEYGEDHAGKLWWDVWKTRTELVEGTGDSHVQAYNYRLCLTREPADRQPVPRPPYGSYHRETYLGLLPDIAKGRLKALTDILSILPLPNGKFDANNHPQGNPSSDLIGGADAWPRATTEQRLELAQQHRDHILGLLYFLQHDPAVPESLRADAAAWGLAADEFPEEAGWPSQIYVREGRRVLGDDTLTEHDTAPAPGGERPPLKADAIAVGSYPCDSHATGGRNPDHPDWLEGFFYLSSGHTKPYGIPYGILLPQGVEGLLVCGAVSATHVGYGSLRMEPVFMSLGLAAGTAADLALTRRQPPRALPITRLQAELLAQGQVLTVFFDLDAKTPGWAGFNLWGAWGAFPSFNARPEAELTAADWTDWLARAPWPAYQAAARRPPLATVAATVRRDLAALGGKAMVLPERPSRAQAMAALWQVTVARLSAGE
jgi:hypothetical protein